MMVVMLGNWTLGQKRLAAIILGGLVLIGLTWLVIRQTLPNETNLTATSGETTTQTAKKSGGDVDEGGKDSNNAALNDSASPAPVASNSASNQSPQSPEGSGTSGGSGSQPTPAGPTLNTVTNSKVFGAVVFDSVAVTCPTGTVALGGGFNGSEPARFFASYLSDNGWYVRAVNGALSSTTVRVYAQCLANIPGSVRVVSATTSIATVSNGTVNKDCPNGSTVVSGGFDAIQNELAITFSARVNNGWRVNADSEVLGDRSLKVLTNCYSGGPINVTQSLEADSVPAGWTWTKAKACDVGLAIGSGFASKAEAFKSYFLTTNSKWSTSVNNRTDSATNFKAYFYCATFAT